MEKKIKNLSIQLTKLIRHTVGEAKYLVKSCIQLSLEAGYDTAVKLSKKW